MNKEQAPARAVAGERNECVMMKSIRSLLVASSAVVLLSGCMGETLREAIGVQQQGPDEFAVYRRAPLQMPPDFSLREPEPGKSRPQEIDPRDLAKRSLSGGRPTAEGGHNPSAGEQGLLAEANAQHADPSIRQEVNRETRQLAKESETVLDGWVGDDNKPGYGAVVDAEAEAERLKKLKQQGKPLTEGETPTIKNQKKGLLEGWFN